MIIKNLAICIFSYLLGSISISILVSKKVYGGDIRAFGSGNAGATNMARNFGLNAGFITLLADMAKAAVAILAGFFLLGDEGLALSGMSCLCGHCFPVFYNFRGGKGVSSGAAIAFAIDWRVGLLAVAAFAVVAFSTRKVSAGSICAALAVFIGSLLFRVCEPKIGLAVFSMCLVIIRHRENIKRLIAGTEADFKLGAGKKTE